MVGESKNQVSTDGMAVGALRIVEVVGPAGVGKTTLSRALRQRHDFIAADVDTRLSKLDKIPFVISDAFLLLPTYLREYRHGRWFNRRETRSMAYLQAGLQLLAQGAPGDHRVTILDHGPIYRLAFLREFGPEITRSHVYRRWWANLLSQWASKIDVFISLDAPEEILLERIRARGSWHSVKDKSDQEAYEILRRYRSAFEQTIAESMAVRRVRLLRFDTSQQTTGEIVDEVSETLVSSNARRGESKIDGRVRGGFTSGLPSGR